jgi:hypothetical protein
VPFSFGRSVFINSQLHTEEEIEDILLHEYIHVRQRHTIDVIWSEILCLLNWYNPFAWLIRFHIRQNLEFIADGKVLENGIDKKKYQYLLLKVTGCSPFKISTPFNFSSLKKRINMMNKIKSAPVHLLRFLFMLPLLAVLLLAFRSTVNLNKFENKDELITVSGIVVGGSNFEPLRNVHFKDSSLKVEGYTDDRGYYTFTISANKYPQPINLLFLKDGYMPISSNSQITNKEKAKSLSLLYFVGMTKDKTEDHTITSFIHSMSVSSQELGLSGHELASTKLLEIKRSHEQSTTLKNLSKDSEKPYWRINGHSYLLSAKGSVSWDTIVNTVFVNGIKMTGDEVNLKIKRSSIKRVGTRGKAEAISMYGVNEDVFEISTND